MNSTPSGRGSSTDPGGNYAIDKKALMTSQYEMKFQAQNRKKEEENNIYGELKIKKLSKNFKNKNRHVFLLYILIKTSAIRVAKFNFLFSLFQVRQLPVQINCKYIKNYSQH